MAQHGTETQPAKKRKLSDDGETDTNSTNVFKGLQLERILREDQRNKLITFVGRFGNDEDQKDAVVLLERLPFDKETLEGALTAEDGKTLETLHNDIYSTHNVFSPRRIAGII